MKRILVVGDSWGAGHVAEDQTDNGWPVMLGIAEELRQAVDGTTAVQWASDFNGMLTRAVMTTCDCCVVSLLGNDAMYAYGDKTITPQEVADATAALRKVLMTLMGVHSRVLVMTYANPYPQDWRAGLVVGAINAAIRACAAGAEIIATSDVLNGPECFACGDFHPSYEGHRRLAKQILVLSNTGAERR